ncbi:MAG: hypothetical protein LQ346_005833 [Caloplaca aetnensis]|nr:MAG: hypothetical protein LQ346_005833 [Caloplaca aetnensis]
MDALDHWDTPYECDTCNASFRTQGQRNDHMEQQGHRANYCIPCQRQFDNANNLKMGTKVSCPFCKRNFATASGVSHHLEGGSCKTAPTFNRENIYRFLRQKDSNGFITNNLLEWRQGETWSAGNAWNGRGYECYLCHRRFNNTRNLAQHLKSPAHMHEIYHCPKRACGTQFKTLAAMLNHLESESCGFIKFGGVQRNVGGILSGQQRTIGFY